MVRKLLGCMSLFALVAQPVVAADIRREIADVSQDWTNLSPRVQCLTRAGLVGGSEGTYQPKTPRDREADLEILDRSIASEIKSLSSQPYNPGWEQSEYRGRIAGLYLVAGVAAIGPRPAVRSIERVLAAGRAVSPPQGSRPDNFNLHHALIMRECAEEYFAVAHGIGEPQGLERYKRARALWMDDTTKWKTSGKPTYYPRELAALNYLTVRELLAAGREKEAFELANDPVMGWATENINYATNFSASFHQLGIGTPRSLPAALAIYQKGRMGTDKVEAASIKAAMGRKAEAAADLRAFMSVTFKGDGSYASANALYAQLTGGRYSPPRPGFMDLVVAIPLAILSYCAKLPAGCATSGGGSSGKPDEPWKAQEQATKNLQQWNDWTSIGKPDY